jgi:transposase InsO family protein
MKARDVTDTLDLALQAFDCDGAKVLHKPLLLSDNGASYIYGKLTDWLEEMQVEHVRSAPYHPQIQRKNERWHQPLKNCILLKSYYTCRAIRSTRLIPLSITITTDANTRACKTYPPLTATSGAARTFCTTEKG